MSAHDRSQLGKTAGEVEYLGNPALRRGYDTDEMKIGGESGLRELGPRDSGQRVCCI